MKKVIYTLLFFFGCTMLFNACTEEEITPKSDNGGGTAIVIIRK